MTEKDYQLYGTKILNLKTKEIGLFYFTSSFKGELKSSIEGECFFAYLKDINKDNYSLDFDIILNLYKDYL